MLFEMSQEEAPNRETVRNIKHTVIKAKNMTELRPTISIISININELKLPKNFV